MYKLLNKIKNNKFLKLILIQIIILIVLMLTILFIKSTLIHLVPNCYWQENYGIICPSCGSTRCVINLINGNFKVSFFYNPFLFILIIYLFLLDLIYIINTIWNKKYLESFYPKWYYIIVYFSLWVFYTIIINII